MSARVIPDADQSNPETAHRAALIATGAGLVAKAFHTPSPEPKSCPISPLFRAIARSTAAGDAALGAVVA